MVDFVQFDSSNPDCFGSLNISYQAVSQILLGPTDVPLPRIREDSPSWAKFFISREYQASEATFRSFIQESVRSVHPHTGRPSPLDYGFMLMGIPGLLSPVFHVFDSFGEPFCLVYGSVTSRVTHIILPMYDCVIYDLDSVCAPLLWEAFKSHVRQVPSIAPSPRRIGVVAMLENFAHQAMNHLSGVQRLIDSNADKLDEVWILGTEFFGKTEDIFPELAGKIRHLGWSEALHLLDDQYLIPFTIGSNFITDALRMKLQGLPLHHKTSGATIYGKFPLLAVTIRSSGRRCVNLVDIVEQIVLGLLPKYPDLGVVLDGWVFPETSVVARSAVVTSMSKPYFSRMQQEADLCHLIASRLPPDVLIGNVVGTTILESIQLLHNVDLYFSHVGTLQHKVGWFTEAQGIVHGPRAELSRMEAGYHSCEGATPPVILDKADVSDIVSQTPRDPKNVDYIIRDASNIICTLDNLLSIRTLSRSRSRGTNLRMAC